MRFAILAILSLLTVGCTPEAPESDSGRVRDQLSQQMAVSDNHESEVRVINQLTARVVEALRSEDVAALKRIGDADFDAEENVRAWHKKLGEGQPESLDHEFIGKGVIAQYRILQTPHELHVCYNRLDGEWRLGSVAVVGW